MKGSERVRNLLKQRGLSAQCRADIAAAIPVLEAAERTTDDFAELDRDGIDRRDGSCRTHPETTMLVVSGGSECNHTLWECPICHRHWMQIHEHEGHHATS
jgi:hypothetical protein